MAKPKSHTASLNEIFIELSHLKLSQNLLNFEKSKVRKGLF